MTSTTNKQEVGSVTFMSYNSTGISSVKCKFICDICDEYDVDYLAVQEHFKNTKTTDKYFRDNFRDYNSYVIPGYRPPGQDAGRSKAGMAQLSRKSENPWVQDTSSSFKPAKWKTSLVKYLYANRSSEDYRV